MGTRSLLAGTTLSAVLIACSGRTGLPTSESTEDGARDGGDHADAVQTAVDARRALAGVRGVDLPASTPFTVDGVDGGACVEVALATYDRSCTSDSDCVSISSGFVCTFGCIGACPNAAINRIGLARYTDSIARLDRSGFCECGNDGSNAVCRNGACVRRSAASSR